VLEWRHANDSTDDGCRQRVRKIARDETVSLPAEIKKDVKPESRFVGAVRGAVRSARRDNLPLDSVLSPGLSFVIAKAFARSGEVFVDACEMIFQRHVRTLIPAVE